MGSVADSQVREGRACLKSMKTCEQAIVRATVGAHLACFTRLMKMDSRCTV